MACSYLRRASELLLTNGGFCLLFTFPVYYLLAARKSWWPSRAKRTGILLTWDFLGSGWNTGWKGWGIGNAFSSESRLEGAFAAFAAQLHAWDGFWFSFGAGALIILRLEMNEYGIFDVFLFFLLRISIANDVHLNKVDLDPSPFHSCSRGATFMFEITLRMKPQVFKKVT